MCRDALSELSLGPSLDAATALSHVLAVAGRCAAHERGDSSAPGDIDAAALAELHGTLACGRRNAALRADYEKRLQRKAKREGKELQFYVSQGATPPTAGDVAELRSLAEGQRVAWWSARFAQHCMVFHAQGRCARADGEHGCAFIHMQAAIAPPSWLLEQSVA
jgi:hypothetical protein